MSAKKKRRSVGKIDKLPPDLKEAVEQMLLNGYSYKEIVSYLKDCGVELSQMSVCRYAEKFLATIELVQVAQENFRVIAEEIEKYPNLDTTEAMLRIASQQVLHALSSAEPEKWEAVELEDILKNVTALIRAAAYKKRTEHQIRTDTETAMEANKDLLSNVLRNHPELYSQVMDVVKQAHEPDAH